MSDFLDYIAVWLPVVCGLLSFVLVGFIIRRRDDSLTRFQTFVRIFLSEGATLKTWGLFLSAGTIMVMLSGVIAKVANDSSWTHDLPVQFARINFFKQIAIGLEILMSIVLGAFGAVAFKGQGPGGISLQLNQDGSALNATGPARPEPPRRPTETPET